MKSNHIQINPGKSERIIRSILKKKDITHLDAIRAQMKSMTMLLNFIADISKQDELGKHLLSFNEQYQASFGFSYSMLEEFEKQVKELENNGENI